MISNQQKALRLALREYVVSRGREVGNVTALRELTEEVTRLTNHGVHHTTAPARVTVVTGKRFA